MAESFLRIARRTARFKTIYTLGRSHSQAFEFEVKQVYSDFVTKLVAPPYKDLDKFYYEYGNTPQTYEVHTCIMRMRCANMYNMTAGASEVRYEDQHICDGVQC